MVSNLVPEITGAMLNHFNLLLLSIFSADWLFVSELGCSAVVYTDFKPLTKYSLCVITLVIACRIGVSLLNATVLSLLLGCAFIDKLSLTVFLSVGLAIGHFILLVSAKLTIEDCAILSASPKNRIL